MNIFHELSAKPWVTDQGRLDNVYAGGTASGLAKKLALGVFLAVVAVLFMLLIIAYSGRMAYEDWRPAPQVGLLWANTFLLILSSVALQWGHYSVRRGRVEAVRVALLGTGAFTVVFLLGQLWAWRQLAATVSFELTNPAVAFFYLITGLHGLHLLGGMVAWGRTVAKVLWRRFDVTQIARSVELLAIYWHFLLLVWLILFGLLFAGNNLDYLLELCGIR